MIAQTALATRSARPAARVRVELVQVLADAVAGAAFVGPAGETFVDDRRVGPDAGRAGRHAEHVGVELVDPAALVGGVHVRGGVRHAVVGDLARDLPLLDARVLAVGPHPTAVQIAGVGADADAAEVHVVADVDREPAPHLRAAPAPRAPRLVAVAARVDELVAHAVGLDPARPAAGLLEVALADARARRRARAAALAALAVDAHRRRERVEREVERDVRRRAAPASASARSCACASTSAVSRHVVSGSMRS